MSVKVCFRMFAYNSEKYIEKTLDSLIAQTEENWILYLINNGSTDSTGKICEEYVKNDSRIIYIKLETNNILTEKEKVIDKKNLEEIAKRQAEYFAVLDSDDYLDPDFIKIMYNEAKASGADVTCCGTSMFIDGQDGKYYLRQPMNCEVLNNSFSKRQFFENYGTLRTLWGKFYKPAEWAYLNDIIENKCKVVNGMDTYCVLTLLIEHTKKIKFIQNPMYFYRVRRNSFYSSKPDKKRCYEGGILFEVGKLLANKANLADNDITDFLYSVYFNHVKDLVEMLNSDTKMNLEEKVDFIEYVFEQQYFREAYNFAKVDIDVLISNVIAKLSNNLTVIEKYKLLKSYVVRMYSEINIPNWTKFNMVWKLAILCDDKNVLNWGNDNTSTVNSSNKEKIIEVVNAPLTKEHIKQKQDLLTSIENDDVNGANENLAKLLETRPLDREALYFKMYIDAFTKQFASAVLVAEIARVFWGKDEEIINMINMVYKEVENNNK